MRSQSGPLCFKLPSKFLSWEVSRDGRCGHNSTNITVPGGGGGEKVQSLQVKWFQDANCHNFNKNVAGTFHIQGIQTSPQTHTLMIYSLGNGHVWAGLSEDFQEVALTAGTSSLCPSHLVPNWGLLGRLWVSSPFKNMLPEQQLSHILGPLAEIRAVRAYGYIRNGAHSWQWQLTYCLQWQLNHAPEMSVFYWFNLGLYCSNSTNN